MPRRRPYTKVEKSNRLRANHVKGKGDVPYRVFQCLNIKCTNFLHIENANHDEDFEIVCPKCGYLHSASGSTIFYDYQLKEKFGTDDNNWKTLETGKFEVLHSEYIESSPIYKYCIICNTLKPLDYFDRHSSRSTGRQGECRLCKGIYNSIKNQTRIGDQHKEAAQKRRLYVEIAGVSEKIDTNRIFERFGGCCFKCGIKLTDGSGQPDTGLFNLDHTLPAFYLYPLTTENATLLCKKHNAEKSGSWPSEYYTENKIRSLSGKTGIPYEVLSGEPKINEKAIEWLRSEENVMHIIDKYAPYENEIFRLRNRIIKYSGFDFFENAKSQLSEDFIQRANEYR